MGDDGVGNYVVRIVKERMLAKTDCEFKDLSVGGLRLVEEMLGYDHVFIVDSIASSDDTIGRIREFSPEQFKTTEQVSAPHVTNFATALELYRRLEPSEIPCTIRIFTIDINPDFTFRENLSPAIQKAADELAESILHEIRPSHR